MASDGGIFCKQFMKIMTVFLLVIAVRNSDMQSRKHEMCNTTQFPFFSFFFFSDRSSFNLIVTGVSVGVGVLIAAVVGLVVLWVLIRRNSRKENTKGDYGMHWVIKKN